MGYKIGEVSKLMGISSDTLRFYDKEGLMPFLQRDEGGRRVFSEDDLNYLEVINCLKKSGIKVKEIGQFIHWCMQGDHSLSQRKAFMDEKEQALEQQIKDLQHMLAFLRWKKWYYTKAHEAGTERIHFIPGTNSVDPKIKAHYDAMLLSESMK